MNASIPHSTVSASLSLSLRLSSVWRDIVVEKSADNFLVLFLRHVDALYATMEVATSAAAFAALSAPLLFAPKKVIFSIFFFLVFRSGVHRFEVSSLRSSDPNPLPPILFLDLIFVVVSAHIVIRLVIFTFYGATTYV